MAIGKGEPPTAAFVNGGEDVGLFLFDAKRDVLDIELEALPRAIEFIAKGMPIGFSISPFAKSHPGTFEDVIDPVRRDRESHLSEIPGQTRRPVVKLLAKRKDLFF